MKNCCKKKMPCVIILVENTKTNLGTFLNAWTGNPRLYKSKVNERSFIMNQSFTMDYFNSHITCRKGLSYEL